MLLIVQSFCIYDVGRKLKSFCLQSLSFWEICKCVSVCISHSRLGEPCHFSLGEKLKKGTLKQIIKVSFAFLQKPYLRR